MGRKKKEIVKNVCPHCQKDFGQKMIWCPRCEDHQGEWAFLQKKDVCDRCFTGENDEYLERKKGRAERVAAAVAAAQDPKNWCNCGVVEAFEKWVNSEEYKHRFDLEPAPAKKSEPKAAPEKTMEEEEEIGTYEPPFCIIPGY